MTRPAYSWLLALLIPAFAVQVALTNPIEEHAYDAAAFHVYRAVVFSDALRDGELYPRWVMPINGGLGGPLFSFYSPLSYYVMDVLNRAGLPHPIAWRVFVALALIAGSAGMFALGLALFRRADVALVAAACFTYAPYLLRDFFERGAPQGTAIALYPWLLWALIRLSERVTGLRLTIASLLWAALLLMHNLSALLLLPILAIFGLFIALRSGIKSLRMPGIALLLGLLLSAFHVLPFLVDSRYVQLNSASGDSAAQPAANPVSLSDLLALPAVFDTGIDNNTSGYGVGTLHALIVLAGVGVALVLWRREQFAQALFVGALALFGLLMLWMQLDPATPVWSAFGLLDILQFRTRLLSTTGLIAALVVGYLVLQLRQRLVVSVLSIVLIILFIASELPSLYPQLLHRYMSFPSVPTVADAQTWAIRNHVPGLTLTTTMELIPRWRKTIFTADEVARIAASPIDNLPDGAHILVTSRKASEVQIKVDTPMPFNAALHVMYFPGWKGYLNGQPQTLQPMDVSGYTLLDVPAGTSTIALRYEGTDAQHIGDLITLLTALALLIAAILWRPEIKPTLDYDYLKAHWWLPLTVIGLVAVKGLWIDPDTSLLRKVSTCNDDAIFGDNIHLCGYDISELALHPGDTLRVMLNWQIEHSTTDSAYAFVHVLGNAFNPATNNPIWSQQDKQEPGTLPIQDWVTGKMVQDTYDLRVPPNTPPGSYRLEIGWYAPDGKRLTPAITDAQQGLARSDLNSVLLNTITVR